MLVVFFAKLDEIISQQYYKIFEVKIITWLQKRNRYVFINNFLPFAIIIQMHSSDKEGKSKIQFFNVCERLFYKSLKLKA